MHKPIQKGATAMWLYLVINNLIDDHKENPKPIETQTVKEDFASDMTYWIFNMHLLN